MQGCVRCKTGARWGIGHGEKPLGELDLYGRHLARMDGSGATPPGNPPPDRSLPHIRQPAVDNASTAGLEAEQKKEQDAKISGVLAWVTMSAQDGAADRRSFRMEKLSSACRREEAEGQDETADADMGRRGMEQPVGESASRPAPEVGGRRLSHGITSCAMSVRGGVVFIGD